MKDSGRRAANSISSRGRREGLLRSLDRNAMTADSTTRKIGGSVWPANWTGKARGTPNRRLWPKKEGVGKKYLRFMSIHQSGEVRRTHRLSGFPFWEKNRGLRIHSEWKKGGFVRSSYSLLSEKRRGKKRRACRREKGKTSRCREILEDRPSRIGRIRAHLKSAEGEGIFARKGSVFSKGV